MTYHAVYAQLERPLRATALSMLTAGYEGTPEQLVATTRRAHEPATPATDHKGP